MNATWAESHAEARSPSALRMAEYHLREKPCGGKANTADSVIDTATTIDISGVSVGPSLQVIPFDG